jgi:hypothetical protein
MGMNLKYPSLFSTRLYKRVPDESSVHSFFSMFSEIEQGGSYVSLKMYFCLGGPESSQSPQCLSSCIDEKGDRGEKS